MVRFNILFSPQDFDSIYFPCLQSYDFFHTLYDVREQIPLGYVLVYGIGNIALQALNWIW